MALSDDERSLMIRSVFLTHHDRADQGWSVLQAVTGHNPLVQNPLSGWFWTKGLYPGGELRPSILKFSFQNPFPVTENDIVHCVLIVQVVMLWGFRPALPLRGGSDPGGMSGGLCPPIPTGEAGTFYSN